MSFATNAELELRFGDNAILVTIWDDIFRERGPTEHDPAALQQSLLGLKSHYYPRLDIGKNNPETVAELVKKADAQIRGTSTLSPSWSGGPEYPGIIPNSAARWNAFLYKFYGPGGMGEPYRASLPLAVPELSPEEKVNLSPWLPRNWDTRKKVGFGLGAALLIFMGWKRWQSVN